MDSCSPASQTLDHRNQRLKRAMDLSMKHTCVPGCVSALLRASVMPPLMRGLLVPRALGTASASGLPGPPAAAPPATLPTEPPSTPTTRPFRRTPPSALTPFSSPSAPIEQSKRANRYLSADMQAKQTPFDFYLLDKVAEARHRSARTHTATLAPHTPLAAR